MPKLPMKFEALSKLLYVAYIGIGGTMLMVFAMAWVAEQVGYGLSATLGLTSGVGLWLTLGLGYDGLERYWKLRHDAEMLKEVDRLQAERMPVSISLDASAFRISVRDAEKAIERFHGRGYL